MGPPVAAVTIRHVREQFPEVGAGEVLQRGNIVDIIGPHRGRSGQVKRGGKESVTGRGDGRDLYHGETTVARTLVWRRRV